MRLGRMSIPSCGRRFFASSPPPRRSTRSHSVRSSGRRSSESGSIVFQARRRIRRSNQPGKHLHSRRRVAVDAGRTLFILTTRNCYSCAEIGYHEKRDRDGRTRVVAMSGSGKHSGKGERRVGVSWHTRCLSCWSLSQNGKATRLGYARQRRPASLGGGAGFDVLLTADKNLGYQQNLKDRKIAIVSSGQDQMDCH